MISQGTVRRVVFLALVPLTVVTLLLVVHFLDSIPGSYIFYSSNTTKGDPPSKIYKHTSPRPVPTPIVDNFPVAANAKSPADLPPLPPWNVPPSPHINESTPLFIPFTRNWRVLQQTVVSYLTAGWPAEDIYVVENAGVMHANLLGQLTPQNPFYLDHHRLTKIFLVNVIRTPTLLTFAQIQNFLTYTALERGWDHYFWAHMDSPVLSEEELPPDPNKTYKSLYARAVDVLKETLSPEWSSWAARWFAYDRLTLVRTQAYMDVGGWDTLIPYYLTDCDMHERLFMHGFSMENAEAGKVFDVDHTLDDLALLYERGLGADAAIREVSTGSRPRKGRRDSAAVPDDDGELGSTPRPSDGDAARKTSAKNTASWNPESLASPAYKDLLFKFDTLQHEKESNPLGRNTWQARQQGGQGEPFYRDPDGFEQGLKMWLEDFGHQVYQQKWGRGFCNLREVGIVEGDEWQLVNEWEDPWARKKWERERLRLEKEAKSKVKEE